jgi:hypothetical protein
MAENSSRGDSESGASAPIEDDTISVDTFLDRITNYAFNRWYREVQ